VPDSDYENTRVASGCMQMARGDLGAALKSEIQRLADGHPAHQEFRRKHELACLRMASDCMQLAGDIQDIELQKRFLELARQLAEAAEPAQTPGPTTSI
jgi:hypothetical protein